MGVVYTTVYSRPDMSTLSLPFLSPLKGLAEDAGTVGQVVGGVRVKTSSNDNRTIIHPNA